MSDEPVLAEVPRPDDDERRPMVLFLCTGNAARSVMGSAMLRARLGPDPVLSVSSAGTHVIPGQVMSVRTRRALERHGLRDPFHRSRQLSPADVARATLILAMERDHLSWIARTHPDAVPITGSLKRIARDLAPPSTAPLHERVAGLGLAGLDFEDWEEVIDPGGGEQPDFDAAADEIATLVDLLVERLGPH